MVINEPNYVLRMYKWEKINGIFTYWLEDSKWFYSSKYIREITYRKGNKYFTIEKYDENEVQRVLKSKRKRKAD